MLICAEVASSILSLLLLLLSSKVVTIYAILVTFATRKPEEVNTSGIGNWG